MLRLRSATIRIICFSALVGIPMLVIGLHYGAFQSNKSNDNIADLNRTAVTSLPGSLIQWFEKPVRHPGGDGGGPGVARPLGERWGPPPTTCTCTTPVGGPAAQPAQVVFSNGSERSAADSQRNNDSSLPRVGICGPALYYFLEDFSIRLVEWLELLRALGVSQVFLYTTRGLHPNIDTVLRHYEDSGFVELTHCDLQSPVTGHSSILDSLSKSSSVLATETTCLVDCLLRNKDSFDFLAELSPDELPILFQHDSLPQLASHLAQLPAHGQQPLPSYQLPLTAFPLDDGLVDNSSALQDTFEFALHSNIPYYFTILTHTRTRVRSSERQYSSHGDSSGHRPDVSQAVGRGDDALDYTRAVFDTRGGADEQLVCAAVGKCQAPLEVGHNTAVVGVFRSTCGAPCSQPGSTREVLELYRNEYQVVPLVDEVLEHLHLLP